MVEKNPRERTLQFPKFHNSRTLAVGVHRAQTNTLHFIFISRLSVDVEVQSRMSSSDSLSVILSVFIGGKAGVRTFVTEFFLRPVTFPARIVRDFVASVGDATETLGGVFRVFLLKVHSNGG